MSHFHVGDVFISNLSPFSWKITKRHEGLSLTGNVKYAVERSPDGFSRDVSDKDFDNWIRFGWEYVSKVKKSFVKEVDD